MGRSEGEWNFPRVTGTLIVIVITSPPSKIELHKSKYFVYNFIILKADVEVAMLIGCILFVGKKLHAGLFTCDGSKLGVGELYLSD